MATLSLRTTRDVGADGSFVRIRTLNFAVEYAGIRVRETTTADETIALVASKLRLDAGEKARRKIVMVYPLATDRGRRGKARWRLRTLRGDESLLALRRQAAHRIALSRPNQAPVVEKQTVVRMSRSRRDDSSREAAREHAAATFRDEIRFYLHDEASTPLDATELPDGDDASGSDSSDDERPPQAKFVADRQILLSKKHTVKVGTLLKRSDVDANLWRRRKVVLVDDRLWYWRETVVPKAKVVLGPQGVAWPSSSSAAAVSAVSTNKAAATAPKKNGRDDDAPAPPKRRGSDSMLATFSSSSPSSSGPTTPALQSSQLPAGRSAWTGASYAAEDLEYDRITRSRAASVPLASNVVTEITGRRDVPHGIEIATASRALVFRAENRAQQVDWLEKLRDAIDMATQHEYLALADMIIADEQQRHVDAQLRQLFGDFDHRHPDEDNNDTTTTTTTTKHNSRR